MSPTPVCAHIPQPLDVVLQLAAQIRAQLHFRQFCGEAVYLFLAEVADARGRVDVEFGHELGAGLGPKAVEGFEGAGDEGGFEEVDAEDERLGRVVSW